MTKVFEIILDVDGEPTVHNSVKAAIESKYSRISINKKTRFWNGQIPPSEKVGVDIDGVYTCILDDWRCDFFGKSYMSDMAAFCSLHNFLAKDLNRKCSFKILDPEAEKGTIDKLLKNEENWRRVKKCFLWVLSILIAAALGHYFPYLIKYIENIHIFG